MSSSQIATVEPSGTLTLTTSGSFEHLQRVAKVFSESQLTPLTFQRNMPNCIIALEMASRIGASPMAVMQNLNIIHGKPSWSATFIIGAINTCGRFTPLNFRITGTGDERTCVAYARLLDQSLPGANELIESAPVSIAMAKAEGWFEKKGSKWQTMPELMLRYRAATFFGRMYAPEILMGMKSEDEAIDIEETTKETPLAQVVSTAAGDQTTTTTETKTSRKPRGGAGASRAAAAEVVVPATEPIPEPAQPEAAAPVTTSSAGGPKDPVTPTVSSESPAPAAGEERPSATTQTEQSAPVTPVVEPAPTKVDVAPAPAVAGDAKPAATESFSLDEPEPAAPKPIRFDITALTPRLTKQGVAIEVACKGDYTGSAYFITQEKTDKDKALKSFPAGVGNVVDAVVDKRGNFFFITSLVVVL